MGGGERGIIIGCQVQWDLGAASCYWLQIGQVRAAVPWHYPQEELFLPGREEYFCKRVILYWRELVGKSPRKISPEEGAAFAYICYLGAVENGGLILIRN